MKRFLGTAATALLLIGGGCAPATAPGGQTPEEFPPSAQPPGVAPGEPTPGTSPGTAPVKVQPPGTTSKLPGNFPTDMPVMAGMTLTGATLTNRVAPADTRYQGLKATWESKNVTPEAIVAFYESKLPLRNPSANPTGDAWVRTATRIDRNGWFISLARFESGTWNTNKDGQIYVSKVENTVYLTMELGVGKAE